MNIMDMEKEIIEMSVDEVEEFEKYRLCCCPQCEFNGYFNRVNIRNDRLKRLIELKAPEFFCATKRECYEKRSMRFSTTCTIKGEFLSREGSTIRKRSGQRRQTEKAV